MRKGWIGIALGDVTGIGPEVTLKALAQERGESQFRYVIVGDLRLLESLNAQLGLGLNLRPFESATNGDVDAVFVIDLASEPLPCNLPPGDPVAANAAIAWLEQTGRLCVKRELAGMVTAPVNKEAIVRAGHKFVGQTEFLSALAGTERTVMMLLGKDDSGRWLRVALATTHVPIRQVADQLTAEKVELAIQLAGQACKDLGLPRSRVGVCGLNPHAGEGGKMGMEEKTIIEPGVRRAKESGADAEGPLSADALFYHAYKGRYDAVVCMYHDQGLAPLKMVCFEHGINWTLGLPFIRTSPDHGTAYDIAGKGIANPSSMVAALQLARSLVRQAL